jgi:hypothetical protein
MRRIDPAPCCSLPSKTFLSLLIMIAFALPVSCFAADNQGPAPATSAYVYVGCCTHLTQNTNYVGEIAGFGVAADGSAQAVPGSPFAGASLNPVAVRSFIFADDFQDVVTYAVGTNGSLQQTSWVNALDKVPDNYEQQIYALNPDRAGQTVNVVVSCGSCNSEVLPYTISANGQLIYIGGPGLPNGPAKWAGNITFSADDRFAYTPDWQGFGFLERNSNGSLSWFYPNNYVYAPILPNQGEEVCNITTVAASAQGYVTLTWTGGGEGCNGPGYELGNYTVAADGSLDLVPGIGVTPQVFQNAMAYDPTGTYLALVGSVPNSSAVQVYKLQPDGTLVASSNVVQLPNAPALSAVAWDNSGHIYATTESCYRGCNGSQSSGLYIFNFDGESLTQAPGSPHPVANPGGVAVVPQS